MNIANSSTGFIDVPGQISVNIYVQGCSLRCPNCHNPELQPFEGGVGIKINELLAVIQNRYMCKWICWLGGDATYQSEEFKYFNKIFKKKNHYICLYTGQYFNDVIDLLDDVDLIIDGPYEEKYGGVAEETTRQKCYLKIDGEFQEMKFNDLEQQIKQHYNNGE